MFLFLIEILNVSVMHNNSFDITLLFELLKKGHSTASTYEQ